MTIADIKDLVKTLSVDERKQLVMVILDSLVEEPPRKRRSLLEFEGVGAHLRDQDAQEYVNELRSEWDDRP